LQIVQVISRMPITGAFSSGFISRRRETCLREQFRIDAAFCLRDG